MTTTEDDPHRREAMDRLRAAVEALAGASAATRQSAEEREGLLAEFRATIRLIEDLFLLLEHHVRGPLTVVKGRAQLLRRHALSAPQPDVRLIAGLNEIDVAVERMVAQLDQLLGPRAPSAGDVSTPADGDPR